MSNHPCKTISVPGKVARFQSFTTRHHTKTTYINRHRYSGSRKAAKKLLPTRPRFTLTDARLTAFIAMHGLQPAIATTIPRALPRVTKKNPCTWSLTASITTTCAVSTTETPKRQVTTTAREPWNAFTSVTTRIGAAQAKVTARG